MTTNLSDNPRDKLQAVLNHDRPDPDDDRGAEYRDSCAAWFATLSGADRSVAERIMEVYSDGNDAKAEWLASALPPAPPFPLP